MAAFKRHLSDDFIKTLNAAYRKGGWWKKVADDKDLVIAIRDNYINVYWRGCSLLKLWLEDGKLRGSTHYKYLLLPRHDEQYVTIDDGVVTMPEPASYFVGKDAFDVATLKRSARGYTGPEKEGVHDVVKANANVIDVEVAFGEGADDEGKASTKRIDFVALRASGDGAELVFYEAKHFGNAELRAKVQAPPVVGQISDYRAILVERRRELVASYQRVCKELCELEGVKERFAEYATLMGKVATKDVPLAVRSDVQLVIFGFDRDQQEGKVWAKHREKLETALGPERLLLKGDAKGFTSGISSPLKQGD